MTFYIAANHSLIYSRTNGASIVAFFPKFAISHPNTKFRKLTKHLNGSVALEDIDDTTYRKTRRETNVKMHMIFPNMQSINKNVVLVCCLTKGFFNPRSHLAHQNFAAALGSPYQVIPAVINTVRPSTNSHTPTRVQILGQERIL